MQRIMYVLAFAVAALPTVAESRELMTGNDILRLCKSEMRSDINACWGYIEGVADRDMLAREAERRSPCESDRLTVSELAALVLKHLDERPDSRRLPAMFVIGAAIAGALGCR